MSLSSQIHINVGHTRSINLHRDSDRLELINAYLPTAKAQQALEQFQLGLTTQQAERSLTLIGPYGSGKSAFGLFLSALLAGKDEPAHQAALAVLKRHNALPSLIEGFSQPHDRSKGFLRIAINGMPGSLSQQILTALALALNTQHDDVLASIALNIQDTLEQAQGKPIDMAQVMTFISDAQDAWALHQGCGVLLEIDELGKFLEYEAENPHQREIHLLQLLAEHAEKSHDAPLHVVVMLHQSFEQYAAHISQRLREEWQKVQGRFKTFAFVESAEQVLRVVESAFEYEGELPASIVDEIDQITTQLAKQQALPQGLDTESAKRLFSNCYPLHPLTLLILPALCQKVAQNERTLFTYLGSQEDYGLLACMDTLTLGEWVYPEALYQYFLLNQSNGFSDPLTYQRWLEVVSALERLELEANAEPVKLMQVIGLMNIIGAQRGFKASEAILTLRFGQQQWPNLIESLVSASVVHFRHYSQEYRVWQGSDFDIHAAVKEVEQELKDLSLATTINDLNPISPLVVRRATIETGTLRSLKPYFVDNKTLERLPDSKDSLRLLFYLQADDEAASPELLLFGQFDVVAICPPSFTQYLKDTLISHLALKQLPDRYAILHNDPVAEHEHQNWLLDAERKTHKVFRILLDEPENLTWCLQHWERIKSRRHLQERLSKWVMEACYDQCPIIHNELINWDKPSASAATGRKRLINAMLTAADQPLLGIEKTPAELSIYLSLLAKTTLHREEEGQYGFYPPISVSETPNTLLPVWEHIHEVLGTDGKKQIPLETLYERLKAPPYGLKAGILPVLTIAYLLAHKREVALYQEGIFCDEITLDVAEMLAKRPVYFSLERFNLSGLRGDLFNEYLNKIIGSQVRDDASLLDIVRPLIKFVSQLPPYTQNCLGLSATAEKVRQAFTQAQSPGLLLFKALPKACGIDHKLFESGDNKVVERFILQLVSVLRELNQAYGNLLNHWQDSIQQALLEGEPVNDLNTLRLLLAERYNGLDSYTPDQKGLGAFIRRISEVSNKSDKAWLESVATLLSGIPPEKWREEHRIQTEAHLQDRARQLKDLERLRSVSVSADHSPDDDVLLIRLMGQSQGEANHTERVVTLSKAQRQQVDKHVDVLDKHLEGMNEEQRLAVLAVLLEKLSG